MQNTIRALALLILVAVSESSFASTMSVYPGNQCMRNGSGANSGYLIIDDSLYNSPNTTTVDVFCPQNRIQVSPPITATTFPLVLFEAASVLIEDWFTNVDSYCYPYQYDWADTFRYGQSKYTCYQAGGCPANQRNISMTGWSWLTWTNPIASGTSYYTKSMGINCSLTSGELHNYTITTN